VATKRQNLSYVGEPPDYRYSLANERTFLAWIRTALALLAGGVALVQLVPEFRITGARETIGVVLAALAAVISGWAYRRWESNERAMRLGQPFAYTRMLAAVTIVLLVVALVTGSLMLLGGRG
jgi:putative membrane protein